MTEARPYRLPSFEKEAQAVLEAARARARELLQRAVAERDRLREEARRAGWEAGLAEGRRTGAAAERERISAETAGLKDLLRGVIGAIEDRRAAVAAEAERDLVRLAVAIAEKIMKVEVEAGRNIAPGNVRHAVGLVTRRHGLRIVLNPADLALVEAYEPTLLHQFEDIQQIVLEARESISRGGCMVVANAGSVDAGLMTQLDEIERSLLG